MQKRVQGSRRKEGFELCWWPVLLLLFVVVMNVAHSEELFAYPVNNPQSTYRGAAAANCNLRSSVEHRAAGTRYAQSPDTN